MECQPGTTSGAAPASVAAADISALLPKSVGQGSLVTKDQREVCPVSRGVMLPWRTQPLSARLQGGVRVLPPPLPAAPWVAPSRTTVPLREDYGLTTLRRDSSVG